MTELKFHTSRLIMISVQILKVLLNHLAHKTDTSNIIELKMLK
jgi:hypothetical protein